MTTYQVVGQCAHVTTHGIDGSKRSELLYKGSIVPGSATVAEIDHLLSLRLIAPMGEGPFSTHEVGAVAGGDIRTGLDGNPVQSAEPGVGTPVDDETEAKRAAARAKLPEGGAMPDGRAGKDVWVEWLVANGSRYEDVAAVDKADLIELARSRQS